MIFRFWNNHKILLLIILFNLAFISYSIGHNSASHDEALMIEMGKHALAGESCPLCAQHTGAVFMQPVLVALGDLAGGLIGARLVSAFFGLLLIISIYLTATRLYSQRLGNIAAFILMSTGTGIYLSKLATYDIFVSLLLSASFLLVVLSSQAKDKQKKNLLLILFAIVLFATGITKYSVAIFWLPFIIYSFRKHSAKSWFIYFLAPFLLLVATYFYFAILPASNYLTGSSSGLYRQGRTDFISIGTRIYYWLAIPYLLAIFGFYHNNKAWRQTILMLILFSSPLLLLHMLTGDSRSIEKNVFFSMIFIAPAAAVGIDQMSSLFSAGEENVLTKNIFCSLVLLVVWAFGLNQLRWLDRQFPDLSPVMAYIKNNGFDRMTIAIDSNFGNPEVIYQYSLKKRFPNAAFFSTSYPVPGQSKTDLSQIKPDFIILDEYYSSEPLPLKFNKYSATGYALSASFPISLPWGKQTIQIIQRR